MEVTVGSNPGSILVGPHLGLLVCVMVPTSGGLVSVAVPLFVGVESTLGDLPDT